MNISEFINGITSGGFDAQFRRLYGGGLNTFLLHRARYISAAEKFSWLYPECSELKIFSAPMVMKIAGNGGRFLYSATGSDMVVFAGRSSDKLISIVSENGEGIEFGPDGLDITEAEQADWSEEAVALATEISPECGLSCYIFPKITSENIGTAALLLATVFNEYSDVKKTDKELAELAAETADADINLLNAALKGGFMLTDSADSVSGHIDFDMGAAGYTLCICDTGESNTAEYSGLCYDDEEQFFSELPQLKKSHDSDELLSALYSFGEKRRAAEAAAALKNGDTEEFFAVLDEPSELPLSSQSALALTAARRLLGGAGALKQDSSGRLLVLAPSYCVEEFAEKYSSIFGEGSCLTEKLRAAGLCELTE